MGKKRKENRFLCAKVVTTRQHAIQCDSYGMLQHRDQTGRIRVLAVRSMGSKLPFVAFFVQTVKTLIRVGGCSAWSESSLDAKSKSLVLSCSGSINLIFKVRISCFK